MLAVSPHVFFFFTAHEYKSRWSSYIIYTLTTATTIRILETGNNGIAEQQNKNSRPCMHIVFPVHIKSCTPSLNFDLWSAVGTTNRTCKGTNIRLTQHAGHTVCTRYKHERKLYWCQMHVSVKWPRKQQISFPTHLKFIGGGNDGSSSVTSIML